MTSSLLFILPLLAQAGDPVRSDVGDYFKFLDAYSAESTCSHSYLSQTWPDIGAWRKQGRDKMFDLLAYHPEPAANRQGELLGQVKKDGYTCYTVRYPITADRSTEAFLLIPDGLKGHAPAVLALHCHGGFYYFGKEKITETENASNVLKHFIADSYGGRCFADELARRGFVVLVPDAFYFGSQRLPAESLPEHYTTQLNKHKPGTDDYIRTFNMVAARHEELTAKSIFDAGSTWPGILFQGDIASVDYLVTRPEVDKERIGCMGLSIGGFRAAHLFALDPRVKAGVVAGWMVTYRSILLDHIRNHTWMVYVPGQHAWLDLPDVVTLNAPNPLMVVNCSRDELFTMDGMKEAEAKIAGVYSKMDASGKFACKYYDEPHSLRVPAQDDAIAWLERWLKK